MATFVPRRHVFRKKGVVEKKLNECAVSKIIRPKNMKGDMREADRFIHVSHSVRTSEMILKMHEVEVLTELTSQSSL